MTVMKNTGFILFIIAVCFTGYAAGEYCSLTLTCSFGEYCCVFDTQCCSGTFTIPVIIGIVAGIIGFLGVIGCVIAVICYFVKRKGHRGQIVHPQQPHTTATVVSTGNNSQQPYGQPAYGQPSYSQQPYGQPPLFAPPAYGTQPNKAGLNQPGQDMAYPPPPPMY